MAQEKWEHQETEIAQGMFDTEGEILARNQFSGNRHLTFVKDIFTHHIHAHTELYGNLLYSYPYLPSIDNE